MEYRATARHARISPTKVRLSADLIRGKRVEDALNMLRFQPRRGSLMVRKVPERIDLVTHDPVSLTPVRSWSQRRR